MIQKNEEYVVDIIDNGFQGEGIAKIDGMTIFIPDAIVGEKIKIKILKVTSSHAFGKIIEIINKSNNRIDVDCPNYSKCGGCAMRHMNYKTTIAFKKNAVESTLKKALGYDLKVDEEIIMELPLYYRNKLQYPIGVDSEGMPQMGIYAERSHRIISTDKCFIQNELSQKIANSFFDFIKENKIPVYNEKTLKGTFRHIVIRIGVKTNEVMVTLVTNEKNIPYEKELISEITKKYPEIKTIVKNINSKNTNVILGRENEVLFGDGYIYDFIGKYKFKISPMSFYQVNPIQTEKLYSKAVEYAELKGTENVFDLYCGIGTIGIFASDKVKNLYGIENIPEAIEDAKQNAKLNNIENSHFFVGDVEKELPEFIKREHIHADVIFVDPPRKGCDKVALDTIMEIAPDKIVYVSCNPATLARDLKILEEKYNIEKVAICDMFPFTHHVESVVSLKLK